MEIQKDKLHKSMELNAVKNSIFLHISICTEQLSSLESAKIKNFFVNYLNTCNNVEECLYIFKISNCLDNVLKSDLMLNRYKYSLNFNLEFGNQKKFIEKFEETDGYILFKSLILFSELL